MESCSANSMISNFERQFCKTPQFVVNRHISWSQAKLIGSILFWRLCSMLQCYHVKLIGKILFFHLKFLWQFITWLDADGWVAAARTGYPAADSVRPQQQQVSEPRSAQDTGGCLKTNHWAAGTRQRTTICPTIASLILTLQLVKILLWKLSIRPSGAVPTAQLNTFLQLY